MPAKNKKSSSSKPVVKVVSEAKRERRRRARQARNARKRAELKTGVPQQHALESRIGVKSGAFDSLMQTARSHAHHVASVIMAVAAPGATKPLRLADSLAPERTSSLSFQQKVDIAVKPPPTQVPIIGKAMSILGRAAFLIADPLYPAWLQGRPALGGASGQHFSMYRTLTIDPSNSVHLTSLMTDFEVDYSTLSQSAVTYGSATGGVPGPEWCSPLGHLDGSLGWFYKPACMMFQGFVVFDNALIPAPQANISVIVDYYDGEAMQSFTCGYVHQQADWPEYAGMHVAHFIAATTKNSAQPPFDFPGGTAPRYSVPGWYRVRQISLAHDPTASGGVILDYVITVKQIVLGLTTDVRTGTVMSQFDQHLDVATYPLIQPGFKSTLPADKNFPDAYVLDETSFDSSFFPMVSTQYVAEAPVLYRNCRCTAVSALFSNVTANINKEGTARAVRCTRSVVNPWGDWRSDNVFVNANPDYARNFKLEDGLYVFAMPDEKSLRFRDCTHDRTSSTGGLIAARPASAAIMDIAGFDNVMLMLFTDVGGDSTHLQVTLEMHHEFKHNSPLWELSTTEVTPDEMAQAIKALQQMQHSFENPLHMSDILRYVQKAAGILLPHVAPFLVDAYNKVAAPALGYSIVPYK